LINTTIVDLSLVNPGTARRQGLSGKDISVFLFGFVCVFSGDVFGLIRKVIV
jgi:hypothetical protein